MKKVTEISINDIDSLAFELNREKEKQSKRKHYVNNKELFKAFEAYHTHKMILKNEHIRQTLNNFGLLDIDQINDEPEDIRIEFNREVKQFTPPPLTDVIGQAIMDISYRRCYSPRFVNYAPNWKEEMISDAIETCIKYAHNFDPAKSNNPFAYLTQLVTNAIFQRIKKEHKQQYIRLKLFDDAHGFAGDVDKNNVNVEDMEVLDETNDMYQDRLAYISNYEDMNGMHKERAKRKKNSDHAFNNILDLLSSTSVDMG